MWRWGTPQNFLLGFIDELWKTWKIRILKKWKKKRCVLTQICSATDIIFCKKFGKNVKNTKRYYPFTLVHHWSRSYDIWFLRYNKQRTKFFVIMGHFLTLLTTQKIKILKKCKKLLEILWFCTKIMMYDSWDIGCNRQIFSHFVPFFALLLLPPPPLYNPHN